MNQQQNKLLPMAQHLSPLVATNFWVDHNAASSQGVQILLPNVQRTLSCVHFAPAATQ
jgi:hypothetical protein